MSARIHEIAKQYNVEPKDMLSWLKAQGYVAADTKSVSSTVSNIYYDEIEKKYGKPAAPVVTPPAPAPAAPLAAALTGRRRRVLITGATGFIGSRLVAALAAAGRRWGAAAQWGPRWQWKGSSP